MDNPSWIATKDQLPELDLSTFSSDRVIFVAIIKNENYEDMFTKRVATGRLHELYTGMRWVTDSGLDVHDATHWMPFPEMPTD